MLASWFSAIGTISVEIVAIWVAKRIEKVKLKVWVGMRILIDGQNKQEFLVFSATNLSERPVTITSIDWRIGRMKKNRRRAIQLLHEISPNQYPRKLEYSDSVMFFSRLNRDEKVINSFKENVIVDQSVDSLEAEFHTSVGAIVRVKSEEEFLKLLRTTPS